MAQALRSRLTRSRFLGGFACGAALGAAAAGLTVAQLLRGRRLPSPPPQSRAAASLEEPPRPPREEPVTESVLKKYGFPVAGAETRCYTNHALSYDQAKRVPRWVIEHISKYKTTGNAERKYCKFRPDPSIPSVFSAMNEDYLGNGWSRGHMAPAGDNKYSPKAMAETFYLSNIVPQNYANNAGFWNRMEMYCRELTERFEDVWIVSGPLTLPQIDNDGKKRVTYQVNKTKDVRNICEVDTCKLMGFEEFTLYITTRKLQSAQTLEKLEKIMSELQGKGIEPDEYLLKVYKKKEEELATKKSTVAREGRAG
ncbi:nuclease EXOG, mitochondrial isoform X5 [Hemicordylus capensis]|uniref:nuclease EXOG, mitochondrial isoform X5 n=1 Tax=Hemicordylus capensis TaxID=884348 RepID=UPI002302C4B6|nr:nuclease EXOG, mitochondrial isoform X5 [Hemicordylus capensis]